MLLFKGGYYKNLSKLTKIAQNGPKSTIFGSIVTWLRLVIKGGFYFISNIHQNGAVSIQGRLLFKGGFY